MESKTNFQFKLTIICITLALLLALPSCGSGTRSTFVDRKALYSENVLKLYVWNIKYDQKGGGEPWSDPLYFTTNKDIGLEDLRQAVLKSNPQTATEMKGKGIFIKKVNDQGTCDYFYIYEDLDKSKSMINGARDMRAYLITSMRATFRMSPDLWIYILFPLFTVESYILPTHFLYSFESQDGYAYEIDSQYTLDDFYDFYQQSGYFDVSKEKNKVILKNIPDPNVISAGYEYKGKTIFEYPIEISVESRDGKSFVVFKMLE